MLRSSPGCVRFEFAQSVALRSKRSIADQTLTCGCNRLEDKGILRRCSRHTRNLTSENRLLSDCVRLSAFSTGHLTGILADVALVDPPDAFCIPANLRHGWGLVAHACFLDVRLTLMVLLEY